MSLLAPVNLRGNCTSPYRQQTPTQARAYLIATGSRAAIPEIEGLQTTGYLTAAEVWQPQPPKKPPSAG